MKSIAQMISAQMKKSETTLIGQIKLLTDLKLKQDARVASLMIQGDMEQSFRAKQVQEAMGKVLFKLHAKNRKKFTNPKQNVT